MFFNILKDVYFLFHCLAPLQTPLRCPLPAISSLSSPRWETRWFFPAAGSHVWGRWPRPPATSSGGPRSRPCSSCGESRCGRRRCLRAGWRFLRRSSGPGIVPWSSATSRSPTRGDTRASWWWMEGGPQKPGSSFRASSCPCLVSWVLFHFLFCLLICYNIVLMFLLVFFHLISSTFRTRDCNLISWEIIPQFSRSLSSYTIIIFLDSFSNCT